MWRLCDLLWNWGELYKIRWQRRLIVDSNVIFIRICFDDCKSDTRKWIVILSVFSLQNNVFFMIFGMTQLFVILEWIFPEIHKKPRFIKKQNIHENRIHLHEYCFFSLLFIHLVSYSWKALPMGNILDCGVAVWPQPRIFIPIPSNLLKVKRWRILP